MAESKLSAIEQRYKEYAKKQTKKRLRHEESSKKAIMRGDYIRKSISANTRMAKLKPQEIYTDTSADISGYKLPEWWPVPRNQSARIFVCSSSGSRKTTWVCNVLTQPAPGGLKNAYSSCIIITDHPGNYSETVLEEFRRRDAQGRRDSEFQVISPSEYKSAKVRPRWFNKKNSDGKANHSIIVIDDGKIKPDDLKQYLTAGRNKNLSLIFVTQDLYGKKGMLTTDVQSNFNVFVLGQLPREEHYIRTFLKRFSGMKFSQREKTKSMLTDKAEDKIENILDCLGLDMLVLFCTNNELIYKFDYSSLA